MELATVAPPSTDELDSYMRQAEMMAKSGMVPAHFRGKPADIMVAALAGRELGMAPIAALQHVVVISGKPTLSAEGRVALLRKHGHSLTGTASPERAVVTGKRRDTGDEITVEWTIQMAQRAGLLRNNTWKQYPEAMLWARAVSQLSRMLFPDVFLGVSYTAEELQDVDPPTVTPIRTELQQSYDRHPASIEAREVKEHVITETGEIMEVVEPAGKPVPPAPRSLREVETVRDIGTVDEPKEPDEAHKKRMAALHAALHEAFDLPPGKGRSDRQATAKDNLLSRYGVDSAADLTPKQVSDLIDLCKKDPVRVRVAAGLADPETAA